MLREIVTEILDTDPEITIRPDIQGEPPAVAIVGSRSGELPPDARDLLERYPRIKVLTVGDDGRETFCYELRPRQVALGELSPKTLLAAIHAAAKARRLA
jgi:hypothetical protein